MREGWLLIGLITCWYQISKGFELVQIKGKGWGQYTILEFTATTLYEKVRIVEIKIVRTTMHIYVSNPIPG